MEPYIFKLPDLGEGVVEAEIVAWHVRSGDVVAEDQPLLDVMTDKATVTIPSVVAGNVVTTNGEVGQMIAVGSELVELSQIPTDPQEAKGRPTPATKPSLNVRPQTPSPVQFPSSHRAQPGPKPLASPAVRNRAREKGVNLLEVTGTGPGGQITNVDIESYLKQITHATNNGHGPTKHISTSEVPISGLRRRIAKKMALSKSNIPHFTYMEQVDITELAALREHLYHEHGQDKPKLSYLPFIMLSLVKAFCKHPEFNAHYDEQREVVTRFQSVHLGIATQTERGLYVPVVRNVETLDLWQASHELKRITRAAHQNTITREELIGSTFTISSLGKMGGLIATPIINHPEVAILGVHRADDRAVVYHGQIAVRHVVNLSASFDHRVVDGADGASLIQSLKHYLEHPATIFL